MKLFLIALAALAQQTFQTEIPVQDATRPATNGQETSIRRDEASEDVAAPGRRVLSRRDTRLDTRITAEKLFLLVESDRTGESKRRQLQYGELTRYRLAGENSDSLAQSRHAAEGEGEQPSRRRLGRYDSQGE